MTTITVPRHIELAIKCLEEDPVQANAINNALAWLRAALAQQAEPSGWMPIETAPKDGTGFDVWVKSTKNAGYGVRMTNVYYSQGVICGMRYPDASFGEVATHWMPLPESPKENSNG